VSAQRGPVIPVAPPAPAQGRGAAGGLANVDTTAGTRVALGRRADQAERELRSDVPDRARVGAAAARGATGSAVAAASADAVGQVSGVSVANMAPRSLVGVANICYRLESSDPNATWGSERLPLIVSTDSAARLGQTMVAVLDAAGRPTPIRARWTRGGADSLLLRLNRIGFSGAIALGPDLGARTGVATSGPVQTAMQDVAVAGYGTEERDASANAPAGAPAARKAAATPPTDGARQEAVASAPASARAAAPAPPAATRPTAAASTTRARVTLRPIACPGR
jgi:hypothetical protein